LKTGIPFISDLYSDTRLNKRRAQRTRYITHIERGEGEEYVSRSVDFLDIFHVITYKRIYIYVRKRIYKHIFCDASRVQTDRVSLCPPPQSTGLFLFRRECCAPRVYIPCVRGARAFLLIRPSKTRGRCHHNNNNNNNNNNCNNNNIYETIYSAHGVYPKLNNWTPA